VLIRSSSTIQELLNQVRHIGSFVKKKYVKNCSEQLEKCLMKEFELRYVDVLIPSWSTIQKLVNKVGHTGLLVKKKYYTLRKILDEIGTRLEDSLQKSLGRVAQEVGISKTCAFRAMKLLDLSHTR
ncbi:hypothetical protein C0J52_02503, partial [Blattella germanica]